MPKHGKGKHKKCNKKQQHKLLNDNTSNDDDVNSRIDFSVITELKNYKSSMSMIHKHHAQDHVSFTYIVTDWIQLLNKDTYPLYDINGNWELNNGFSDAFKNIHKRQYSNAIKILNPIFSEYETLNHNSQDTEIRLTMITVKSRLAYCYVMTKNYNDAYETFQYMLTNLYLLKQQGNKKYKSIIEPQYANTILHILAIYNVDDKHEIHTNVFNLCKLAMQNISHDKYQNDIYDKLCGLCTLTFLKYSSIHDQRELPREQLISEYITQLFAPNAANNVQNTIIALYNKQCAQYTQDDRCIITNLYFIKLLCDFNQYELAAALYDYLDMSSNIHLTTQYHSEIYFYLATYYYSTQCENKTEQNIQQAIKYCEKLLYDETIKSKLLASSAIVIYNYLSILYIQNHNYALFDKLTSQYHKLLIQAKVLILESLLNELQLHDDKMLYLMHREYELLPKTLKTLDALTRTNTPGVDAKETDANLDRLQEPLRLFVANIEDELNNFPPNSTKLTDCNFAYYHFLGQILFNCAQYDKSYEVLRYIIKNKSYDFQGYFNHDKMIFTYIQSCVQLKKFDELHDMCQHILNNPDNTMHDIYIVTNYVRLYLNPYYKIHHLTEQDDNSYNMLLEYCEDITTPIKHAKAVLAIDKDYLQNARALIAETYCEYYDIQIVQRFIELSCAKYEILLDGYLAQMDQMKLNLIEYYIE